MSGAGAASYAATSTTAAAAQNGNAATATASPSVAATMQSSLSWRGNPYVPPVGGGGSGGSGAGVGAGGLSPYYSSQTQSPQSQHSPQQHRAP